MTRRAQWHLWSYDPGRHGAIYLTPSGRILPATTASFAGDEQVWAAIMNALAGAHDTAVQMIDTSIIRVASAWSLHQPE